MYISADSFGCVGSSLKTAFLELSKREYDVWDGYNYTDSTGSKPSKKTVIAMAVGITLGCLFFIALPWVYVYFGIWRERRIERKKNQQKEKEKMERLLAAAKNSGEYTEDSNVRMSSTHNLNDLESSESAWSQSIKKPSNAILSSKNSFPSSQRTSYEYEPLPPYEAVQASVNMEHI